MGGTYVAFLPPGAWTVQVESARGRWERPGTLVLEAGAQVHLPLRTGED
jgi:hypothetical protein